MTRVKTLYLQPNGRCRAAETEDAAQAPSFLLNHQDRQAHTLNDLPVFYLSDTPRFTDWETLLNATPPLPDHIAETPMCVVEEGNPWPISFIEVPDLQDRQLQWAEFENICQQLAEPQAVRASYAGGVMRAWHIVSLGVFSIVCAVILLFVIQSKLGKDLIDIAAPGLWIFFALGMVLAPPRPETPSAEGSTGVAGAAAQLTKPRRRRIRRPRPPKYRDWERVIIWDSINGNVVWAAELPLSVLYDNIPPGCRYTFEEGQARLWGAGVWGASALITIFGGLFASPVPLFWVAIGAPILAVPFALWGWLKAYVKWVPTAIWVVRKKWTAVPRTDGAAGEPTVLAPSIEGVHHTLGTGVDPQASAQVRKIKAISAWRAEQRIKRQAATALQQPAAEPNGHHEDLVVPPEVHLADYFLAQNYLAHFLYEEIRALDFKQKFVSLRKESFPIEKVSMAGMALGSIGLLIVAMLLLG